MSTLLRTVHGSHLYGMSHADSDMDWYVVTLEGRKPKQTIVDWEDTTSVPIGSFLRFLDLGVPQAVEALFSRVAQIDPAWYPYFRSLRVGGPAGSMLVKYRQTAVNFANYPGFKQRRHALRLCLNMRELRASGYFNPTLSGSEIDMITDIASLDTEQYTSEFERMLNE